MIKFFRYLSLTLTWAIVALTEIFLLTAGLVSQGHDKGRLIPIAFFVILVPALGYLVHRFVNWALPATKPGSKQAP